MCGSMGALVSRRRFELLALVVGMLFAGLHWWSDDTPVQGQKGSDANQIVRAVQLLEGRAADLKFRWRGERPAHPDILIAEVDEYAAQKYGRWPWDRELVATAITRLHEAGVAAVGMDIIFTDESVNEAGRAYGQAAHDLEDVLQSDGRGESRQMSSLLDRLGERSRRSPDDALAAAFSTAPEVVLGVVTYSPDEAKQFATLLGSEEAVLAPAVIKEAAGKTPTSKFPIPLDRIPSYPAFSAQTPLRKFVRDSSWLGHFSERADPDGTIRRVPLFIRLERPSGLLPSLELRTAALYFGAALEPVYDPDQGKIVAARLRREGKPAIRVPIELAEPQTLVNYPGSDHVFKRKSLADIIEGKFQPEELKGKAVLMAVSLVGEFDQAVTPFNEVTPGVFVHASMLSNILTGDFLTRPPELRLVELLFILLSSLALGFFLPRINYVWKLVTIALVFGGWLVADYQLFVHGWQLATVVPAANVLVAAFSVIFLGYLSVDREKGRLRVAFQHYLNESVMEQMLGHPEKLKLGGEKREMTVLFSDIRGFTTLSERMAPEALVKFINSYLTPMTRIVFQEGGTLDKYIGDALMAFWGAPLDQADHAMRACRAAVQFLGKLEELKLAWRDQNLPEFDIGVGINTGPMIVGNMGSDIRFDYTVMGDSVNLASRLEGTNKEYHTRILMSEATWEQTKDQVIARRLGAVRVKGKRKPVRIYELKGLGQAQGTEAEAIAAFEQGVDAFVDQKFEPAEALFKRVLGIWPGDAPAERYIEDIGILKVRPPGPGWDGVFTATTK